MGNSFVTRHYQLTLPDTAPPATPPNKSEEMPAHRPNVAGYMPGQKTAKPNNAKPKTLKHHRWIRGKKKRSAS